MCLSHKSFNMTLKTLNLVQQNWMCTNKAKDTITKKTNNKNLQSGLTVQHRNVLGLVSQCTIPRLTWFTGSIRFNHNIT